MRNREEYNKEIDKTARLNFHNNLESLNYLIIPINFKGKVTRKDVCAKLEEWQTYDKTILNLKTKEYKGVKGLFLD